MRFRYIRINRRRCRIDTQLTLEQFREASPRFFSWAIKGERVSVHRGFVISNQRFAPSVGPVRRRVVIYAYRTRHRSTYCVCLDAGTMRGARRLIQWLLKELDTCPEVKSMMDVKPV